MNNHEPHRKSVHFSRVSGLIIAALLIALVNTSYSRRHSSNDSDCAAPGKPAEPQLISTEQSAVVPTKTASFEELVFRSADSRASLTRLNLSPEQTERLRDLDRDRDHISELAADTSRSESVLYELLASPNASEQDILDAVNRLNEKTADQRIALTRLILELRKILTAEQRASALSMALESANNLFRVPPHVATETAGASEDFEPPADEEIIPE